MDIKKRIITEYFSDADHEDQSRSLRTITLFGKNSSTYKFALTHALLNQNANNSQIKYEDLQDDFLSEFVRNYETVPNQFSKVGSNRVTQALDIYLRSGKSERGWLELKKATAPIWHNYVFDAFHNVGGGKIDKKWWLFEHDKYSSKLVMTDMLLAVLENPKQRQSMLLENEARWNIVQSAWAEGLSTNIVTLNEQDNSLVIVGKLSQRRIGIRSVLDALLPYQKGRCFYCNCSVDRHANQNEDNFPDVDHFFAHSFLKMKVYESEILVNKDGIWNLVIACKSCNRGGLGKFDSRPAKPYFEKLINRNLLFIEEDRHAFKNGVLETLGVTHKTHMVSKMWELWKDFEVFKEWMPKY